MFCVFFFQGLHYSFQTSDKLYFVLDYVNGGEVNFLCYLLDLFRANFLPF